MTPASHSSLSDSLHRNHLLVGRATAFGLLWIALAVQLSWTVRHASRPGRLAFSLIFTGGMLPFAVTLGRVPVFARLGRLIVGGAFLKALLERPGDWGRFVRYTGRVNAFLPLEIIPALAVFATVIEILLCAGILLEIRTQWAAAGSAALLFLFATVMTISGLSQAEWAVYMLSAGAFALATTGE